RGGLDDEDLLLGSVARAAGPFDRLRHQGNGHDGHGGGPGDERPREPGRAQLRQQYRDDERGGRVSAEGDGAPVLVRRERGPQRGGAGEERGEAVEGEVDDQGTLRHAPSVRGRAPTLPACRPPVTASPSRWTVWTR